MTAQRATLPEAIAGPGIIAICRRLRPEDLDPLIAAMLDGGIRAVEVTLDGAGALDAIRRAATGAEERGLLLGAGTVLDVEAARAAVEAGARFLVMPHAGIGVVEWAVDSGVPVLPGAMTPTEVLGCWRAGATAVKVFPASVVGTSFLREMGGPLRDIALVPTGGVRIDDVGPFIAAGAAAVGLGGGLIGDGTPDGVRERAASAVTAVTDARRTMGG